MIVGGAPCPPALRARAERAGVRVVDAYGMTETWGGWALDGRPIAGADARVAAADGELEVRGAMVMRGYRLDPIQTAAVLAPDGWLATGDVGVIDDDGIVRVVDRKKDLVITGGINVSPTEVEGVLSHHPDIRDVCIVGAPDDEWGERVVAYVVPAEAGTPPSLEQLRAFGREQLSAAKLPLRAATGHRDPAQRGRQAAAARPARRTRSDSRGPVGASSATDLELPRCESLASGGCHRETMSRQPEPFTTRRLIATSSSRVPSSVLRPRRSSTVRCSMFSSSSWGPEPARVSPTSGAGPAACRGVPREARPRRHWGGCVAGNARRRAVRPPRDRVRRRAARRPSRGRGITRRRCLLVLHHLHAAQPSRGRVDPDRASPQAHRIPAAGIPGRQR